MFPAVANSKPPYHRCPENALGLLGLAWDTVQFSLVRPSPGPVHMVRGEGSSEGQVDASRRGLRFPHYIRIPDRK